jgi:hypothetical protein
MPALSGLSTNDLIAFVIGIQTLLPPFWPFSPDIDPDLSIMMNMSSGTRSPW